MNYTDYNNMKIVCQDCGYPNFSWYDESKLISQCTRCEFKYQLQVIEQKIPVMIVDPESSVVPYTKPRNFVKRYITQTAKLWVPVNNNINYSRI